ncbi:MAG: hypothetical protein LBK22_09265 [Tannerella sp.]|nr:hypothetical protein [Tannerella sp.]
MEKLKLKTVLYSLLFAGIGMAGFNSCASPEEAPDGPKPDENILSGKLKLTGSEFIMQEDDDDEIRRFEIRAYR